MLHCFFSICPLQISPQNLISLALSYCCVSCVFLFSCERVLWCILTVSEVFPLTIISVSSWTLCILLMSTSFVLLVLLIFLWVLGLPVMLILFIFARFSLSHSSFYYLYLILITLCHSLYSVSYIGIVCCLLLIKSKITPRIDFFNR